MNILKYYLANPEAWVILNPQTWMWWGTESFHLFQQSWGLFPTLLNEVILILKI